MRLARFARFARFASTFTTATAPTPALSARFALVFVLLLFRAAHFQLCCVVILFHVLDAIWLCDSQYMPLEMSVVNTL